MCPPLDEPMLALLKSAWFQDKEAPFFKTFIVGEDGRVDIIEDNDLAPQWQLGNVRPGLWRSFVAFTDNGESLGLWAVWLWDGGSSKELLQQMAGQCALSEEMVETIQKRVQNDYIDNLAWQDWKHVYGPSAQRGIALRPRFVLSADFYSFLHGGAGMETGSKAEEEWRATMDEWFDTQEAWIDADFGETAGAEMGGAILGITGIVETFASAKDEQGRIIGMLIGKMHDYQSDEESIRQDYDGIEHDEAFDDLSGLEAVTLKCIHGGDPDFENETPNYLPPIEVRLEVEHLLTDTARAAGRLLVDHLITKQNSYINPYIDLSHMKGENCPPCQAHVGVPPVKFDAEPTFWAQFRRQGGPHHTLVTYHLTLMNQLATSVVPSWINRFRAKDTGIIEWSAPADWHRPSRPTVCPADEYSLHPVFRYVGCGYALTPDSTYPPWKASHIWRWVPPRIGNDPLREPGLYDPFRVMYELGKQPDDILELLGHTVIALGGDGSSHFLDVFGIDSVRRILFGWARIDGTRSPYHPDRFLAAVLPGTSTFGPPLPPESDSPRPPFRSIFVETVGFPRCVPPPTPTREWLESVPVVCRQAATRESPNRVRDIVLHIPRNLAHSYDMIPILLGLNSPEKLGGQLFQKHLLHPLFETTTTEAMTRKGGDDRGILTTSVGNAQLFEAIFACILRGQAPEEYSLTAEWTFCRRQISLPLPIHRQQPADTAWVAPQEWFEPKLPEVDRTAHYHRLDVMSYVGCGYVLPPWATYPPDKTRFIWSRLDMDNIEKNSFIFEVRRANCEMLQSDSLLDILGQTAIVREGEYGYKSVDVIGVDQERGLVFGFSRMEDHDKFVSFQLESHRDKPEAQLSTLANPGLEPIYIRAFGLPILK